jgi:hypothetical protein
MTRALLLAMILSLAAGVADAKQCRDPHGKFIKCPPPHATAVHKPCRDKHGKFIRCPALEHRY